MLNFAWLIFSSTSILQSDNNLLTQTKLGKSSANMAVKRVLEEELTIDKWTSGNIPGNIRLA